jgi:hypothetical protein
MELTMNKKYQYATQKLHKFVSDDLTLTDAEVREELEAQGVDVTAFLARLETESVLAAAQPAKLPSASERLRALASRAGDKMKTLLGQAGSVSTLPGASVAYGRKGKSQANNKKVNGSPKRRK